MRKTASFLAAFGLCCILWPGSPAAGEDAPVLSVKDAMALARSGQSERAVGELKRFLSRPGNEANVEAYMSLGLVYYKARQYDNALAAFTRVLELKPGHPMAYYFTGHIYEKKAIGTADPAKIRELKTKALGAWQDYLGCADTLRRRPESHRNIGITVKESIRRARRHVQVLQEELLK